jgi:hypothetical protein
MIVIDPNVRAHEKSSMLLSWAEKCLHECPPRSGVNYTTWASSELLLNVIEDEIP